MINRKIFDYSLKIFLVVSTLFFVRPVKGMSDETIRASGYVFQERFFIFGVLFMLAMSFLIDGKRKADLRILGVYLIALVLTSTLINYELSTTKALLNIFIGVIFYKVVVEYFDFKNIRSYGWWFFCLLLLNLVVAITQYFSVDMIFTSRNPELGTIEPSGFMKLRAHLGVLTAMISPLLVLFSPWLLIVAIPLLCFRNYYLPSLPPCMRRRIPRHVNFPYVNNGHNKQRTKRHAKP